MDNICYPKFRIRAGHLFRSGCTSYTVSSNRLSTENSPALSSCGRCIWGKTARFTGTATENLRAGHADHRIGGIGPDQRTVQQGYTYAESHRNTGCFGNRCGLRQEAQTTGAERRLAEERRARSGKIIDEQQSVGRSDRRGHPVEANAGHHRFRTGTGAGTVPGTA